MKVCVYCASSETIDRDYIEAGERFGELLAENGHTLVFGAGKYGVMGAVARGIRRKDGKAIGIIPKFFDSVDVMFTDCEIVKTDTMRERKMIMEDTSDAFVMLPGGIGTYEEFFEILTLKQLHRHEKPIAIYNIDGYFDDMLRMLDSTIEKGFMSEKCRKLFFVGTKADGVLSYIADYKPFFYSKYEFLEGGDKSEN